MGVDLTSVVSVVLGALSRASRYGILINWSHSKSGCVLLIDPRFWHLEPLSPRLVDAAVSDKLRQGFLVPL